MFAALVLCDEVILGWRRRLSHLSIALWWSGLGASVGVGWQLSVPLNPLSVSGETIPSYSKHNEDILHPKLKTKPKQKQGFVWRKWLSGQKYLVISKSVC